MKKFCIIFGGLAIALVAMGQSGGPVEIRRGGGNGGVATLDGLATNLQVYSSGTTNRPLRVYSTNAEAVWVDKDGGLTISFDSGASHLKIAGHDTGTGATEFIRLAYDTSSSTYDYVARRNGGTGYLQWYGMQLGSVGYYFDFLGSSTTDYRRLALTTGSGYVALEAQSGGSDGGNADLQLTPAGTGSVAVGGFPVKLGDLSGDPATVSNSGFLYGKDVAGTVEVFVMDEAGNVTQISPHARRSSPAPANVDAGDKTPIVIHHQNIYTGEEEWLHLSAMARKLEQLTGEKFVFKRKLPANRVRDWDAEQERLRKEREALRKLEQAAVAEWLANTNANKGPRPIVRSAYVPKPKPTFLDN